MSDERKEEFRVLAKTAHDAIDDYVEARLASGRDYFAEGLDNKLQNAVHRLLAFGDPVIGSTKGKESFDTR